jgi:hypothetical protein
VLRKVFENRDSRVVRLACEEGLEGGPEIRAIRRHYNSEGWTLELEIVPLRTTLPGAPVASIRIVTWTPDGGGSVRTERLDE